MFFKACKCRLELRCFVDVFYAQLGGVSKYDGQNVLIDSGLSPTAAEDVIEIDACLFIIRDAAFEVSLLADEQ